MKDDGSTDLDIFECPRCGGRDYSVWVLPHPLLLHWILNPGLAFNELVLGQRIPDMVFFCETCTGPWAKRDYVYCPNCRAFHDGMIWSVGCAFGNWLGLVCPDCGQPIPSLRNLTSKVLLMITFPLWWLPLKRFRHRYLVWSKGRTEASRRKLIMRFHT